MLDKDWEAPRTNHGNIWCFGVNQLGPNQEMLDYYFVANKFRWKMQDKELSNWIEDIIKAKIKN
jgi:hypothetical protein